MEPVRRRGAARRLARPGVVLACALAASCASFLAPEPTESGALARGEPGASVHLPALRALHAAVTDHEDELAGQILARLRRRPLADAELELVDGFERVLVGRELVAGLELTLEARPTVRGTNELVLRARSTLGPLTLRIPPGTVEHLRVAFDASGVESKELGTRLARAIGPAEGIAIPSGEDLEIPLGEYSAALGRAVGVREGWRLRLRSGELDNASGTYPAADLPAPTCEALLVADALRGPFDPEAWRDLAARALAGEELEPNALLEHALRADEAERRVAMEVLLPLLEAPTPDAAVGGSRATAAAALAPSLSWLARTSEPGADLSAWARWIRGARDAVAPEEERETRGNLDIGVGAAGPEGNG